MEEPQFKVLCVASDLMALATLKRAAASPRCSLSPGATNELEALAQLATERPHVLLVFGDFGGLTTEVRQRFPVMRIVADRGLPGVTVVAESIDEVPDVVLPPQPSRSAGATFELVLPPPSSRSAGGASA